MSTSRMVNIITGREGASLAAMLNAREIEEVANRLKQLRAMTGLEQAAFAKGAGMTQNRYNQYETGARPLTLDAATRICDRYGATLDWLFRSRSDVMPHAMVEAIRAQTASPPQK